MKNYIKLFLLLLLSLSLLLSCAPSDGGSANNGGNGGGDNAGDQTAPVEDKNAVWSSAVTPTIIVSDTDSFVFHNELATHIYDLTGVVPNVQQSIAENTAHEISLGETGSELANKAYVRLDYTFNLSELEDNGESAWLILAEDGNIAVAYTDTLAKKAAIEYIIGNFTSATFAPQNGVVAKESFEIEEYLDILREEQRDITFNTVADKLGQNAAQALKQVYSLYDEDLYVWIANLYCPDIGGFYYSNSARDNEGFLPDLESTGQALGLLGNSGIAQLYTNPYSSDPSDKWAAMLPYETAENILAFAKSLQAEDGYFYHPQWGTGITSSRRGRDAGWGKGIILAMGEKPDYEIKYEISATASLHSLTDRLHGGTAVAVSKVVATAAVDPIYSSEENFIAYLEELFASGNSYSAGNTLNSTISEISGYGLRGTLCDWLIKNQNPDNGLWEDEISYQSVNGLMKLCGLFGGKYPSFPNAEIAIDSAMIILMRPLDDELDGITTVYNPWYAIYKLLGTVGDAKKAELREMLYKNAANIFSMTAEKLSAFKKPDGGFSYNREFSAPYSQSALVAVSGSVESDVNATTIAVSTIATYMESVFGITFPEIYSAYDSIYFLDTLAKMDTIIKNRVEDPVVDTFDDFIESDGQIDGNVVMRPGQYIGNVVGDPDSSSDGYKWFESSVVPNPAPGADPDDLVLYVGDKVYPDEDKNIATEASKTEFKISNFSVPGSCYVFEADMLFNKVADASAPLAQLTYVREGSALISAWIDFYQYQRYGQNYIRIQEYFAGADGVKDSEIAAGIPVDEWFKLRVELYKEYSSETGEIVIKIKVFVNGVLAGVSDSGHYDTAKGAYKDFLISMVRLSYYRHTESSLYLNNVFVGKNTQSYSYSGNKLEEGEASEDKNIWDFEGGIPNEDKNFSEMFYNDKDLGKTSINPVFWNDALDSEYESTAGTKLYSAVDPTNAANKVLKAYAYNTKTSSYKATTYVDDEILAADGTTYEIEFDYYFEMIPWLFAPDFFSVNLQNSHGSNMASVTFSANGYDTMHYNATSLGIKVGNEKLENISVKYNRWYSFKMVYYYNPAAPETSRMVISILYDGEYVCISDTVLPSKLGEITHVGFTFHCYDIRGTQYLDDIAVSRTDLAYKYIAPNTEIDDKISIQGDDTVYITDSSRGKGVYYEKSISYSAATYSKLINGGYMAKNLYRGDGTELTDKVTKIVRSLSFDKVEGDAALTYTTLGSGNHAINFVSQADAVDGFIFETDVKFVDIDNHPDRFIRFTGTNSNGVGDSDLWGLNLKFTKNLNEDVGGVIATLAGSEKSFGIPNDTWINVRLEAKGLNKGDQLVLYINGIEVETVALTASIKGIKGIELYTSSTYGGHGWENGSVCIDNTYVTGTGTPPSVYEITESSRGEGEYADLAIGYEGKTYADLVSEGLMSANATRGDGVSDGNRSIIVDNEIEGISYLAYASRGSGNHGVNFLAQNKAYDGFVFETDIKLNLVDTSEARAISFTGNSTTGSSDGKLWAYKIFLYENPDKAGTYVIKIANSDEKVIINNNSWTNIRLVAYGLENGSELVLFVNGEAKIRTTLNADITGIVGVELYTPSTYLGNHGWESGEIGLDNTYASGTGMKPGFPVVSGASRGEGANLGNAISYDNTTYADIIASGKMTNNTAPQRGDGVSAGNRTVSLVDVNGNGALAYTSTGSGNHSLNFALEKEVGTGLIFETDIMLDGVKTSESRGISFIGTSSGGTANADNWNFSLKIVSNPDAEQGGYLLTIGGSPYHVVIPDKTWVNIRLEFRGYRIGEEFDIYINGELVETSSMNGSIANIKGVELYTASTYNGEEGFSAGTIYLDNTYVTGTGEKPTTPPAQPETPQTPESNNTGGNMDGEAWDNG